MKKLLMMLFKKGAKATAGFRSMFKSAHGGSWFHSSSFKNMLKGLSLGVGSSVIASYVMGVLKESSDKMQRRIGFTTYPDGSQVNPRLSEKYQNIRDNITVFSSDRDDPRYTKIRQTVILDMIYVLAFQNGEDAHASLTTAESAVQIALAGSWFQEEHDSDMLSRYFMNLAENNLDSRSAEARMLKALDFAAAGGPLV